jgi:hypothetical protein
MAERVTEPVMGLFDIDRFRNVTLFADEMKAAGGMVRYTACISKIWPH